MHNEYFIIKKVKKIFYSKFKSKVFKHFYFFKPLVNYLVPSIPIFIPLNLFFYKIISNNTKNLKINLILINY